jgi:outer membrane protein assembly factor BamB
MSLRAEPHWYELGKVGEHGPMREGFMQLEDGGWLMGHGRQNGNFACVNVSDGTVRWEHPILSSASDVITCDVDGDGQYEFVFGTSHGHLYAIGDGGDEPRLVWRTNLSASVGPPIAADVNGDGISEIITVTTDGYVYVLGKSTLN